MFRQIDVYKRQKVLAKLPIDSDLAKCVDEGRVEPFEGNYLDDAAQEIEKALA